MITARQGSLSITNSRSSPKLMSIESVMPSSHLILCRPLSSCPQSLPASGSFPMSQLFAWERGVRATIVIILIRLFYPEKVLSCPFTISSTHWPQLICFLPPILPLIEIHKKKMQHAGFLSGCFAWHNACDYHPYRCVNNSFLCIVCRCSMAQMYHSSIRLYSSWWTVCFQLLQSFFQFGIIINKAAFEKTLCINSSCW